MAERRIAECMHPSRPTRWERLEGSQVDLVLAGFCPFSATHDEWPPGHDRNDRHLRPVVGYECSEDEDPAEVATWLCCSLGIFYRARLIPTE